MLVEIVGTRMLTPFFGVGLYVWSALLVVTLGSLSVGYYVGGWLADRHLGAALPLELIIAGGGVAMAPVLRVPLLRVLDGADLRLGALVSALILFGPALCAMGMVSTTAVKLAVQGSSETGRSVGLVYAVSTLGGLLGTLMAGFWLVPNFPVSGILWTAALALVTMGLSGLRRSERGRAIPIAAVLLLLLPLIDMDHVAGPWEVLERRASVYGELSVVKDTSHGLPLRLLRADHSLIGAQWEGGEPAFEFVHVLESAVLAHPSAKKALLIGLGIGSVAPYLIEQGIEVDVVELDPGVVDLAREHFGFQTNGQMFVQDARTLLRTLDTRYDIIIHDTFTGGATPEHLLSLEVMQLLRARLRPDGLLVLNLVGATRGEVSVATRAVDRTIREAFPYVRLFRDGPPKTEGQLRNLVFFAGRDPIDFDWSFAQSDTSPARKKVFSQMSSWEVSSPLSGGRLITDENNPIASLGTAVSEKHHAAMREMYPTEFWLR
jgi:hypothetical protein